MPKKPADADRYLVIDGRRWRRSDPSIPETLAAELVKSLMNARRAVGAAKRAHDTSAERAARKHVNDAKVALGERGHPYWEEPDDAKLRVRATATIHALLDARGPDKTICPSDVARVIGGSGWRSRMTLVRELAVELAGHGVLCLRQRGKKIDPTSLRGPIRIGHLTP